MADPTPYQGYNPTPLYPTAPNTAAQPLGQNPNLNNISTASANGGSGGATYTGNDPSFAPTQPAPAAAPPNPGGLQTATPYSTGVDLTQAGAGENVGNAMIAHYSQSGTPTTTQNTQQAYQDFRASTPANMDPYYDNAERLSNNAINTQMAARGSYGSSNAVGVLSNADTNLRAQQARDEAQYGLQRAGLSGTLAGGADASSHTSSQDELNWMNGLTGVGMAVQNANIGRGQTLLGDQNQADATAAGIQATTADQAIQSDDAILTAMMAAGSGATADEVTAMQNKLAQDQQANANNMAGITAGASAAGNAYQQYLKDQKDKEAADKAASTV